MPTKKSNHYDFTIVLPEAQEKINRQFNSITKLQDFAKSIFAIATIAMSVFSAIISTQHEYFSLSLNLFLFVMIFVTYAFLTYFGVRSILPVSLKHAIEPSWKTYSKVCCGKNKEKSYEILVSQYLEAIEENEPILVEQYERSKDICLILAILMTFIFVQSVVMFAAH